MNTLTITGRLGDDIDLRWTPQGKAVANGRIADTPRRYNDQTQQWEDAGEALWLSFALWGPKAEALAEAAHKGSLIMAHGRLKQRSYDANDGTKRTVIELDASEVAVVAPQRSQRQSQPQGNPGGGDPWGNPQPATETAPRSARVYVLSG